MALLRVGWWEKFSSHKVYSPSGASGICPLVRFFLQCVSSNTLVFWGNIEGSALFLRVPLWLSVSDVFGGGSKFVKKLDNHVCERWLVFPVWYSWRSPLLLLGCCILPLLSGGSLVGFSYLGSLCERGSEIIGCTASQLWRDILGSVFPDLWFCLYVTKKVLKGCLSLSPVDFFGGCPSYNFVEEERIKYR